MRSKIFLFLLVITCAIADGYLQNNDIQQESLRKSKPDGNNEEKEESDDPCFENPCENGGTCEITGDSYTCSCKPGNRGQHCEKDDPCFKNPCKNGGTCKDSGDSYTCSCKPGNRGQHCEKVNLCKEDSCSEHGTCVPHSTGENFTCMCERGYIGDKCQHEDPCEEDSCHKHGRCIPTADGVGFTCNCTKEYAGEFCEHETPCKETSCSKRGTCIPKREGKAYTCKCDQGYSGDECEKDPCKDVTCQNGGECRRNDDGKGYTCQCKPGYTGKNCETEIPDPCKDKTCNNRGKCKPDGKDYKCTCDSGFTGKDCENEIPVNPCKGKICNKRGKCEVTQDKKDYACNCNAGFSGKDCEIVNVCKDKDCNRRGKCDLAKNKKDYLCICNVGFAGKDCERELPCAGNPCGNNGKCAVAKGGKSYTCNCDKGYAFHSKTCLIAWCQEVGDTLCPTKCKFDNTSKTGYCECGKNEYFDHKTKECHGFEECSLVECKENEVCTNGKCVCKEPLVEKDKKCVSVACDGTPCEDGAECKENPTVPGTHLCFCKSGYYYSDGECKLSTCDVPGKSKCLQICDIEGDKEECDCHEGFKLKDDKKTCTLEDKETKCGKLKCKIGDCIKEGDKEVCVCPPGFVQNDTETGCIIDTNNDICSGSNYIEDKKKCNCTGKYKEASDGITCQLKRCSDKDAQDDCKKQNGICIDKDDGYFCDCPPGSALDDGACRGLCEIPKNEDACLKKHMVCEVKLEGGVPTPHCVCPVGFQLEGGVCKLATRSYLFSPVPIVKPASYKKDKSFGMLEVKANAEKSIPELFPNVKGVNVLECSEDGDDLACKLEIQFETKQSNETLNRFKVSKNCNSDDKVRKDACLFAQSLLLRKSKIQKVEIRGISLCTEGIKEKHCGDLADCEENKCSCKIGFTSYGLKYGEGYTIKRCEDVDECKGDHQCTRNNTCVNTIGSYFCECQKGYTKPYEKFARNKDGCIDLCHPGACGKGSCNKTGDYTIDCSCQPGYGGSFCNRADPNFKSASQKTVVVGSILGVLLGLTLLAFFIMYRRFRKNRYSQDFTSGGRQGDAEMMERRQLRQGVTNRGYQ